MKFNKQILVIAVLFILFVVLCFNWVSKEMFENHSTTQVYQNMLSTNHNLEHTNVVPVSSSNLSKNDPGGYNGLIYYQDFETHYNSSNLPSQ
jgi:uncharacterized membrane protein